MSAPSKHSGNYYRLNNYSEVLQPNGPTKWQLYALIERASTTKLCGHIKSTTLENDDDRAVHLPLLRSLVLKPK